jgi:hypothetical protein
VELLSIEGKRLVSRLKVYSRDNGAFVAHGSMPLTVDRDSESTYGFLRAMSI